MIVNRHRIVLLMVLSGLTWRAQPLSADDAPPTETDEAAASEPAGTVAGVQFATDFAASGGAKLTLTDGQDAQREGDWHWKLAAYASVPPDQPRVLKQVIAEDHQTNGPDEKPGVLRLQYADVPIEAKYSGFLLYGDEESGKLMMPGWDLGNVTMADLRRTFIEFKFRADNPNDPNDFGGMYQFRFEPEHKDSYGRRANFGVLIATRRWRTFRRPIGSATNLEAFLSTINKDNPPHFKLVWGQHDSIQRYRPGSSLLIDDLKIVIE